MASRSGLAMKIARSVVAIAMGALLPPALHPVPAVAQDTPPAWAAESPAAAGAWIALGLDGGYERLNGPRISSATTTTTLLDLEHGTRVTSVVDDDPALLNRKFDLHWRSTGAGAQVPIALPALPLAGLRIYPALVLQAAWSRTTLGIVDKPEPADNTSVDGRGAILGLGLDLAAPLCRGCPWFASVGFRAHLMPAITASSSPAVAAPGFAVAENQTRLRLHGGEGLLRIGRSLAGGRIAPYLGLLRRRDLLTIDDTVALRSEQVAQETLLHTRTRIAASGTAGIAGVGVRLSGPLLLRLETTFGDRLFTLSLKISHLGLVARPPIAAGEHERQRESPQGEERSQEEVARQLIPALAEAREELERAATALGIGLPGAPSTGYTRRNVYLLLDQTEATLLAALAGPELVAMRDYVHDLIETARAEVAAMPAVRASLPPAALAVPAALRQAPATGAAAAQGVGGERRRAAAAGQAQEHLDPAAVDRMLERNRKAIDTIQTQANQRDLQLDLCVKSEPPGAVFKMRPVSYDHWLLRRTNNLLPRVWRGLYKYVATPASRQLKPATDGGIGLDLVAGSPSAVVCYFEKTGARLDSICQAESGSSAPCVPR